MTWSSRAAPPRRVVCDKRTVFGRGARVGVGEATYRARSCPPRSRAASSSSAWTCACRPARGRRNVVIHPDTASPTSPRPWPPTQRAPEERGGAAMKVTLFTRSTRPTCTAAPACREEPVPRALQAGDVEVRCFGDQSSSDPHLTVKGYQAWSRMWRGTTSASTHARHLLDEPVDGSRSHRRRPRALPYWYGSMSGSCEGLYEIRTWRRCTRSSR